jgi:Ca2+-binding RTX toxin-like protein
MDVISNGGSRKAPRGRAVLVLAVSALAVLIVGGTTLASTKRCPTDCFGTKKADTLVVNAQGYDFFGRAGSDVVRARGGEDNLYGQAGADRLLAGPGPYDYLAGGTGDDAIEGGGGTDLYYFGDGWGRDSLRDATVGNRAIFESYGGEPVSENPV